MAEIAPFAGIHYDPARVALADVIAPPYDVLSPAQQDALYARQSDNIVRLILSREQADDSETDNRYTRAAQFLHDGLASGLMVQDDTPAFYEYVQRFEHPVNPEQIVTRHTLFVALKLEPYEKGVVLPHELTHPKAKADRLLLMRATRANPEPIYGLFEDPDFTLSRSLDTARKDADLQPLLRAAFDTEHGPEREEHLVYRHTDACLLGDLEEFFGPRRVWIADGHHRYETALAYANEQRVQITSPDPHAEYNYILIGLSAFEDPGLVVLPTHRLVKNVSPARRADLLLQLNRYFEVQTIPLDTARHWLHEQTPTHKRFVIVSSDKTYALTLRDLGLMDNAVSEPHSAAWRELDVSVLQTLVLDRTFGIDGPALAHTSDVAYTRDESEAITRVQSGEFQYACLLQNPTVTEVRDVALAGDKMPQKSTFFYPKLWSGLILRSLDAQGE